MQNICLQGKPASPFLGISDEIEDVTLLNTASDSIKKYLVRYRQKQSTNLITEFTLPGEFETYMVSQELLSISKQFSDLILPVKKVFANLTSPGHTQVTLIHPAAIELSTELPPHYKYSESKVISIIKVILTAIESTINQKSAFTAATDPSCIYRIKNDFFLYPYYEELVRRLSQNSNKTENKSILYDTGILASFLYSGISRDQLIKSEMDEIAKSLNHQKASSGFVQLILLLLNGKDSDLMTIQELIKYANSLKQLDSDGANLKSISPNLAIWNYHTEEINAGKPADHQKKGHLGILLFFFL